MIQRLLDEDSRDGLRRLAEFLLELRRWAESGEALTGLGELVATLEELAEQSSAEIGIVVGEEQPSMDLKRRARTTPG